MQSNPRCFHPNVSGTLLTRSTLERSSVSYPSPVTNLGVTSVILPPICYIVTGQVNENPQYPSGYGTNDFTNSWLCSVGEGGQGYSAYCTGAFQSIITHVLPYMQLIVSILQGTDKRAWADLGKYAHEVICQLNFVLGDGELTCDEALINKTKKLKR